MADPWPVSLPQFVLVDGYSEEEADAVIEHKPDLGPPITRLATTAAARPLAVSFDLSRAQLATLRAFFRTTLMMGSLPFVFSAPSEPGTYLLKFQKGGGPKVAGYGGNYFRVACQFLVLP